MGVTEKIHAELEMAINARVKGNEGMARVCARRAAGLAVREYVRKNHIRETGRLTNELLSDNSLRKHLPVAIHPALTHLTTRVDVNHNIMDGIDLINEARIVIQTLAEDLNQP